MEPIVAVVVSDLMFQPRITEGLRAIGADARIADTAGSAEAALGEGLAAMVIDLHAEGIDAPALIARAKAAGARVLAFGRHTDAAALRAARQAGAEAVVARSQLVEELPALLRALLEPSPTPPAA
ncbi:MAG: DNA-binding response regulator [Dehalococcoidia bacterium]